MSGAPRRHPFLPNLDGEFVARMLRKAGVATLDDLFSDIPDGVRLNRPLRIPEGGSEYQVRRDVQARLSQNKTPPGTLCFLGGGVWPHYVPAAVESRVSTP
ncbi:MAG: hypothetical protein JRM95_04270 [Nitrososphaerota archaeon]|nr:hypothetical protein [Nitrososphaerota archaeon]